MHFMFNTVALCQTARKHPVWAITLCACVRVYPSWCQEQMTTNGRTEKWGKTKEPRCSHAHRNVWPCLMWQKKAKHKGIVPICLHLCCVAAYRETGIRSKNTTCCLASIYTLFLFFSSVWTGKHKWLLAMLVTLSVHFCDTAVWRLH